MLSAPLYHLSEFKKKTGHQITGNTFDSTGSTSASHPIPSHPHPSSAMTDSIKYTIEKLNTSNINDRGVLWMKDIHDLMMAEGLPAEAIALQDPITYAGTINNKAVAAIPVVSLYDFALNNIEPPASYTEDANGTPVFADNKTRQRITSINAANATAIKNIKAGMDARLQDAISDKLDGAGPHHLWKALKTAIKPHLAAKIYEDQFNAANPTSRSVSQGLC